MYDILLGLVTAYYVTYYIYPTKCGEYPIICPTIKPFIHNGLIILPVKHNKAIHIHHWIIACLLLLIFVYFDYSGFAVGFALGFFLHGISYSDCFEFVCNNPY